MAQRKPKDRSREILERIVGTKSKATLAEAFKLAFAEKFKVKQEEVIEERTKPTAEVLSDSLLAKVKEELPGKVEAAVEVKEEVEA